MARKRVMFVADGLENAQKFRAALDHLDVEVQVGSTRQFEHLAGREGSFDLAIVEERSVTSIGAQILEERLSEYELPVLVIVNTDELTNFRLPVAVMSDFVMAEASIEECVTRIRLLLWPGNEGSSNDIVSIDGMIVNLATYQVTVDDAPVDLTYLEYALLSFLVTHPGRTYSRDALLKRVWGFDYYGGSRTVDVHVRRIRAKLGSELSAHLETVRGVGYLWNA